MRKQSEVIGGKKRRERGNVAVRGREILTSISRHRHIPLLYGAVRGTNGKGNVLADEKKARGMRPIVPCVLFCFCFHFSSFFRDYSLFHLFFFHCFP